MQLFRQEAMRSQDRLHGDVDLAPPTSWQTISLGIAGSFIVAAIFLSLASYTRVSDAVGVIESTLGTVDVSSGLGGSIAKVNVVEGQKVKKGDLLLIVDHRTGSTDGSLEMRRAEAVAAEDVAISQREPAIRLASEARIAALASEADAARADLESATEQMAPQQELVDAARQDLAKAKTIALNGFVSQQDIRRREEALATRVQGMSRLRQQAANARASISRASRDADQERATMMSQIREIAGDRAQIKGRAAAQDAAPQTTLTSPVDGTVTGIAAAPGSNITPENVAMSIIPTGGDLRIRLALPPQAAALVAPGQIAKIAIDAFPYQTYGTISAQITDVTAAAVPTKDGPRFIAYAMPEKNSVTAYGKSQPLRPGMTANARIRTMERTLLQWLLDPVYAVSRR